LISRQSWSRLASKREPVADRPVELTVRAGTLISDARGTDFGSFDKAYTHLQTNSLRKLDKEQ
jgi:hypothetical protein